MQSTVVDERIYKCIEAISKHNQSLALKYWNQILRYQTNPHKKKTVLNQLIRESYHDKPENILPLVQFIEETKQFYGFHTLYKELQLYNLVYDPKTNDVIFTLAHYVKKACGSNSPLFKSLPKAVRYVMAGKSFTLQNKETNGYLYYAKRCVARHYYYCLDVLTKRIERHELNNLEMEEKRKFSWTINATDETAQRFFILNQDTYWTYRLQGLKNSPRFKMEESGSSFEIDWAEFQLELRNDEEIAIQVRNANKYLEGEEFKAANGSEMLLNSVFNDDRLEKDDGIIWVVQSSGDEENSFDDHGELMSENCGVE